MALKEVNKKESSFVFCRWFYVKVDLTDQFDGVSLVCTFLYCKSVMQCGTDLVLVLTPSCQSLGLSRLYKLWSWL